MEGVPYIPKLGVKLGRPTNESRQVVKSKPGPKPQAVKAHLAQLQSSLVLTSGRAVLEKILAKALNDADKDQAMMLKILAERFLHMSAFDNSQADKPTGITVSVTSTDGTVTTVTTGKSQLDAVDEDEARTVEAEDAVLVNMVETEADNGRD